MGIVAYHWRWGVPVPEEGTVNTVWEMMEQVRAQVNGARIKAGRGLKPLTPCNNLYRAAQQRVNDWMGHRETEGDAMEQARAMFYTGEKCALLWGTGTIQPLEICDTWLRKPECAAVIDGDWDEMGVAFGGSESNLYCAVFFGKRLAWPHEEMPTQDGIQIAMRDGLSYFQHAPASVKVGVS